ncbi:hypothetical protein JCM19233_6606 [Vibrio astriarenae]|nr:hypothetical protein JCM19233_6606 [Vibrio sp. C7]
MKAYSFPYIVIHRRPSSRLFLLREEAEWKALKSRDTIELLAHNNLSHSAIIASATEVIHHYIRFNPDFLAPIARLVGFELKLTETQRVLFSPNGEITTSFKRTKGFTHP